MRRELIGAIEWINWHMHRDNTSGDHDQIKKRMKEKKKTYRRGEKIFE